MIKKQCPPYHSRGGVAPGPFYRISYDSEPKYPFGQDSFAVTFKGMTADDAKYLVMGGGGRRSAPGG